MSTALEASTALWSCIAVKARATIARGARGGADPLGILLAVVGVDRAYIGEVDSLLRKNLVVLMSLATDEECIAGARQLKGGMDGLAAIGDALLLGLGDALHDVVYDALGVFGAGVVAGDDADVAVASGGLAHEGTLGLVAIAPAAKDGDEATRAAEAAHGRADVVYRIGGVCVVDKALHVVDTADELKAPRYLGAMGDGRDGVAQRDACGTTACDGGEAVGYIKVSDERCAHEVLSALIVQLELATLQRDNARCGAVVGVVCEPEAAHAHQWRELLIEAATIGVIDVDDSCGLARAVGDHVVEELLFRLVVFFHVAMVVEVVLGEIRKDTDAELRARAAFLAQGMRGDLHRDGAAAILHHGGE